MAMMSIADAYKSAIAEEMRRDPSVFVLGEDEDIPGGMGGAFTVTKGIGDEFGANVRVAKENGFEMKGQDIGKIRCINTPISEILIAGVCVGFVVDAVWYAFLSSSTGLYEIIPGFLCGLLAAVIVSLCSKAPSKEVTDLFDRAFEPTD